MTKYFCQWPNTLSYLTTGPADSSSLNSPSPLHDSNGKIVSSRNDTGDVQINVYSDPSGFALR